MTAAVARRLTRFLLPVSLAVFTAVAGAEFRDLPAQVPVHFGPSGLADRFVTPRQFVGLMVITTAFLGIALLFARYYAATEQVDATHVYARQPYVRDRVVLVLDVVGAAAVLLLAWAGHLCVQAAHQPEPALPRLALMLPVAALVLAAGLAAWWTRPVWAKSPSASGR